mmetsp:Transcript_85544/g.128181  ORF Transcript_85544/g.128181 Transcript_85544/m.128181 type:complete len:210 (-) Transcript_85544:199-828(-)
MGGGSSKVVASGSLQGAYAPPLHDMTLPPALQSEQDFSVTVPQGKQGGDTMIVAVHGQNTEIQIPSLKKDGSRFKAGDRFMFRHRGDAHKVIASTLPSLPGTIIIESKPIIWASVTSAFSGGNEGRGSMIANQVASLMQQAQGELLKRTVEVGCNVVLGVTTNVTTDSSGERGYMKLIIITMTGTPCNVVPVETIPAVPAEAVLVPMHN